MLAAGAPPSPIGKPVENFSLPDFHGKMHSLVDYQDKPVVLAFLGTECPLANNYASRLRDLAAEFEASKVVFLGIDANLQDSLAEIGAFGRAHGIAFPMLKDNNNEIADRLKPFAPRGFSISIASTWFAIGGASTTSLVSRPAPRM